MHYAINLILILFYFILLLILHHLSLSRKCSVSVAHINKKEGMDVHRSFYRSESDSSFTDQTKARNQCKNNNKNENKLNNGDGSGCGNGNEHKNKNENDYCSQNNESLHNTVSSTQLEMDFIIASVYDEEIQKLFGNISAREVAVSCTRNRELEKQKIILKQQKNKNKNRNRNRKRGRGCEVKNGNKMEEEEVEEEKNNGNMDMDGARMDPPSSSPCLASTSASTSHSRCLNRSHEGKAEHNRQMHFCQNSEIEQLLHLLPSFNYSASCARTVDSLVKSSYKKEQYTFLLRLNQFVDDNGIRISGGRSALSLEGILSFT